MVWTICQRSDRNVDCPDGITNSKHTIPSDLKPKLSEKDKNIEKSVVNRAMMVAKSIGLHSSLNKSNSSPRSNRKRNMLLAKRRNVSVRDICPGDSEGWLTYRSRGAGGAWVKAWFVLKCSSLYRFKTQDSVKADCLIVLTGFTVSLANEIKSRKYSFKVYHTGTVFYFAADTEDSLILWLDAVSKSTLGVDVQSQNVGLFSETDESDNESHKNKPKCTSELSTSNLDKSNMEKSSGSLKKTMRKDIGPFKDHENVGTSLDRKYLKFLSARNQNMPVPTAQFRSYRRVLPTSTPKKEVCNSPDLQMTIAGSTFYGTTTSQMHTNTDTLSNPDMNDYAIDRYINRTSDNLQSFIMQELPQDNEQQRDTINESMSVRMTPLNSDHVHIQHRILNDNVAYTEQTRQSSDISLNEISNIYDKTNNVSNNNVTCVQSNTHVLMSRQFIKDNFIAARFESDVSCVNDKSCSKCKAIAQKKMRDSSSYAQKKKAEKYVNSQKAGQDDSFQWISAINPNRPNFPNQNVDYELNKCTQSPNQENYRGHDYFSSRNLRHSGSNNDLTNHIPSETQQNIKKDALINRKGSFNLASHHDYNSSDKYWLNSLRRSDKKGSSCDKNRLKSVAQYQPPPIPTSPFEQEGMRAAFEMHLDSKNNQIQKASRLKVLFGGKQQKPCTSDLPKNTQKTILEVGSPQMHRALFRNKYCSNLSQHQLPSGNQNSNGNNQCYNSFNNSSQYDDGYLTNQKGFSNSSKNITPPILPYIPPPTSPPPDYPDLEYPPVFEPGTYSLSDASLLRNRNKSNQNTSQ